MISVTIIINNISAGLWRWVWSPSCMTRTCPASGTGAARQEECYTIETQPRSEITFICFPAGSRHRDESEIASQVSGSQLLVTRLSLSPVLLRTLSTHPASPGTSWEGLLHQSRGDRKELQWACIGRLVIGLEEGEGKKGRMPEVWVWCVWSLHVT